MKFIAVDNLEGKTYTKEFLCKARNARNLTSFKIRMIFPHVQAQLVVFGRDVLILQSAEKGFVGW
jgi:hypothetical protein